MNLQDIFKDIPSDTAKYGVIGWPLSHTLSPAMHNAAIRAMGLKAVYRAIPVPAESFNDFIAQTLTLPLSGFNVTVPYKELVIKTAMPGFAIGGFVAGFLLSVNTVSWDISRKGWGGTSTDGHGFLDDVAELSIPLRGKKIVLLGAGGSASAIFGAFYEEGVEPRLVTIVNRTVSRARALKERLEKGHSQKDEILSRIQLLSRLDTGFKPFEADVAEDPLAVRRALEEADVVINTTSIGLQAGEKHIVDFAWLGTGRRELTVYDLVYHRETELLAAARTAGARAVGGLGMLVHQGARAFEIWFNRRPPTDVMRRAAEDELKRRSTT